jgi:site-specific DNA-methyltransferase (adenine-specific)
MIQLIQGDCLEKMCDIPDGGIDLVLCDPPYGTTACKWDTVIPFEPMWEQLKRVTKKNGAIVLFGSQPFTSALVMSNPSQFKYSWIWDKKLATGHLNAKRMPMKRHEDILVFYTGVSIYNPQLVKRNEGKRINKGTGKIQGLNDSAYGVRKDSSGEYDFRQPTSILEISNADRTNRLHPTQKPVALMEYLIKTYTNENETVFDFTMGSGTTGVACKNLNRNFIGIELVPTYYEIACKRIGIDTPTHYVS